MKVSAFIHVEDAELRARPCTEKSPHYAVLDVNYATTIFIPKDRIDDFIEAALALKGKPDAK